MHPNFTAAQRAEFIGRFTQMGCTDDLLKDMGFTSAAQLKHWIEGQGLCYECKEQ